MQKTAVQTVAKKRGWLTGKFSPLHLGHINFIQNAATQVDELVVVVSHNGNRFADPRLELKNRVLWLRQQFVDLPHIRIEWIDETNIPEYPNGWQAWSDLIKGRIGTNFARIFTSEVGDYANYQKYFPHQEVVLVDPKRIGINISATEIRVNPLAAWSFMPSVSRQQFLRRVCLVGQESSGKTTMTKYLAKRFGTSWVEEYGRTYCERDLCGDEFLLRFQDYGVIAARRYEQEQEAARSANQVLFVDTNAAVTNYFCRLYEGRCNPLVTEYEKLERYDLVIFLEADVPWVDDGLRRNPHSEHNKQLQLEQLRANYNGELPLVFVQGNYHERLQKCIALVENLLAKG